MRATLFCGPHDIQVQTVPDPSLQAPDEVIVRVTHACICGSDLWPYRGIDPREPGTRMGHEFMGVVEDVGSEVRTMQKGDRVIAPFVYSDGSCEFCHEGLQTSCLHGGFWGALGVDGGQGEAVRVPHADGTLVVLPPSVDNDEGLLKAILPLTDVMGTGYHAALRARVGPGRIACVIGDGAVGLCGVLSAKRLGAERLIVLGHHPERLAIARQFGATDVVTSRGPEAVEAVRALTGHGAHSVLECVGTEESMATAIAVARPGGTIGMVGVPHGVKQLNVFTLFRGNITLSGGVAPVRAYLPELLADVVAGTLDPSPVLDMTVDLEHVPDGYAAMDQRRALKVMVRP